jgi:hypothetical protein
VRQASEARGAIFEQNQQLQLQLQLQAAAEPDVPPRYATMAGDQEGQQDARADIGRFNEKTLCDASCCGPSAVSP